MVAVGLLILSCLTNVATAQNGYDVFQQGLAKERGEGDIGGAIKIYERVVREFKTNQLLVAKALIQLGVCYEKLAPAQARQYYDEVIDKYSDQKDLAAEARSRRAALPTFVATESLRDRPVWKDASFDGYTSSISTDGTYLGWVARTRDGGITTRDLKAGMNRILVKADDADLGGPVFSRDGQRVAYTRRDRAQDAYELRVVAINGTSDRLILKSRDVRYWPKDWTPNGRVLTVLSGNNRSQIALVDASTGATQTLKSFLGSVEPGDLTLSPDGRFVAYDFPQDESSGKRDVFVLDTAPGLQEYNLVQSPANDYALGWTPDGKWLLFGSDRGDSLDVWAVEMVQGKPTGMAPLRLKAAAGEMHSVGITRTGSLLYTLSAKTTEVRALESVLPELARLQLAALQQGRPQTASSGSIEGVLVKAGTNEPVVAANIELLRLEGTSSAPLSPGIPKYGTVLPSGTTSTPPPQLAPELQYAKSDEKGRFVFRNLKPGGYRLVAMATSADCPCNPSEYGQHSPRQRGMLLPLAEGEAKNAVRLEMALAGVVTGRVTDEDGEPLGHVTVIAAEVGYEYGQRTSRVEEMVLTDERGEYRLRWLPPGRYLIAARMEEAETRSMSTWIGPSGRSGGAIQLGQPLRVPRFLANGDLIEESYELAFLGGNSDPEKARPLDVAAGSVSSAADISMTGARKKAHHIRGVLINGDTNQPAANTNLQAIPVQPSPSMIVPGSLTDANGIFDIMGAVAGKYIIVSPYLPPSNASIAYMPIEVNDSDIDNLRVVAQPVATIPGKITVESRSPAIESQLSKIVVLVARSSNSIAMPRPSPQNSVSLSDGDGLYRGGGGYSPTIDNAGLLNLKLSPGEYRISITNLPANTYVKSARMGQTDALSGVLRIDASAPDPLEIILGNGTAEVTGLTIGSQKEPFTNAVVALVPDAISLRSRADLYKNTTSDALGRFTFGEVPPGDYKIFAWDYTQTGSWMNGEFLQPYESTGKLIHVIEGRKQETEVLVTPRR
jgi:hypothetical protein